MILCAWCSAVLDADALPGMVSHGACKGCRAELEAQIVALRAEAIANADPDPCEHGTPPELPCTACLAQK